MRTLEEAWKWYISVSEGMKRLNRLGKHWEQLPWSSSDEWMQRLSRDNVLGQLTQSQLIEEAAIVAEELDDLAILVFFSVFEARIRALISNQVKPEVLGIKHSTLKKVAEDFLDSIDNGSIGKLLETLDLDPEWKARLEQVNQVRRWRNWVAHGRRKEKPRDQVDPGSAYARLTSFLTFVEEQAITV